MANMDEPSASTENENSIIPSLSKPSLLLPIAKHRRELLYTIETYPVTIVIGQTGSGKTTQLPQFLDQGGWCANGKIVAVTQVGRSALEKYSCPPRKKSYLFCQPRGPRDGLYLPLRNRGKHA